MGLLETRSWRSRLEEGRPRARMAEQLAGQQAGGGQQEAVGGLPASSASRGTRPDCPISSDEGHITEVGAHR